MSNDDNYYYHMWLGIAPEEMPTNAYRLFGLQLFESNALAIQNAAQQRITYVQSFLDSEHGEAAQRMIDALSQAASALLDPNAKSIYDQQLTQFLSTPKPTDAQGIASIPEAQASQESAEPSSVFQEDGSTPLSVVTPDQIASKPAFPNSALLESAVPSNPPPSHPADSSIQNQSTQYQLVAGPVSPISPQTPVTQQGPTMQPPQTPQMTTAAPVGVQPSRKPTRKQSSLVFEIAKIVLGGIAGIAIGFVGVAALKPSFDVFGWFHDKQVVEAARRQNQRVTKPPVRTRPAPSRPNASQVRPKPPATIDRPASGVSTPDKPQTPSTNQVVPKPVPFAAPRTTVSKDDAAGEPTKHSPATTVEIPTEDPTKEKPPEPQIQLPKSVALPSLLDNQPKVLARFPATANKEIDISLINAASKTVEGTFLALQAASDKSLRWQARLVSSNPESNVQFIPLAEFAITDQDLVFHWLEPAVDHAAFAQQLLNCALRITNDDKTHTVALRQPVALDGQSLSLAKKTNLHEIPIQHLPKTETLYIELHHLDRFPVSAVVKKATVGKVGREIKIELPETPGAEIRLRMIRQTGGGLALVVAPIYKTAGVEFDLSVDRLEGIKDGTQKALEKAAKSLPLKQQEYSVAQSQLQNVVRSSAGTATQQTIKAQQVASLTRRVRSLNKQLLTLQRTITEMQQRLAALPEAEALINQLHNKAVLRFRVFSVADGNEIELVRAGVELGSQ